MLLPSLLKSGDQVYQKVIKQLYQKMLLLNLLITVFQHFHQIRHRLIALQAPTEL